MKQYVQTDLEADRKVANAFAGLIIGGALASAEITGKLREDLGVKTGGNAGEAA